MVRGYSRIRAVLGTHIVQDGFGDMDPELFASLYREDLSFGWLRLVNTIT